MKAGDRVLNYIVDRELGEGGMGTVYLARHTALDQLVAIKSLSLMLSRDEALRARFLQEANIQAKLRHPGIVQVLTADMESEQPSLVMEYIEGKSLSEVLELRGALPIDDALKVMEQVLSAVGYAHRQGVIHRDLKPSNVMVMASGEAKVTDFGIAKVLGSSKLTRTGTAMGSAHYMSPEQIRRPETVDARSDIYSLGCVFYEVLTGRPPFGEKDASGTESDYEVKTAHVTEAAPALETVKSSIPAWLAKLVMSMLEKEPDQRPSSCETIVAALVGGSSVEKTQIIQDNEKSDWGQPESDQDEFHKEPLKTVEASSVEKKADKSSNAAVVIVIVLVAIVGAIVLKMGKDTPSDKQEAGPPQVTAPQNEQIGENINRKQESTTPLQPAAPLHEQIAENIARQAEQLALKIKEGNPNKLKPCPEGQHARRHNCWGTYTSTDGDQYVGEWKDNKNHGQGIYTYAEGTKYIGEFKYGRHHGLGKWSNQGDEYLGEFKDGFFYGRGTDILSDGTKYVGEWKGEDQIDTGIEYRADGSVASIYRNGKLIKSQ